MSNAADICTRIRQALTWSECPVFILDPRLNPSAGGCPTPTLGQPHAAILQNSCEFWSSILNKGEYSTRHALERVVLVGASEDRLNLLIAHIQDPDHLDRYRQAAGIEASEEMFWNVMTGPDGDSCFQRMRPSPSIMNAAGAVYEASRLVVRRFKDSPRKLNSKEAAQLIWRALGMHEKAAAKAAVWSSNAAKAYKRELAARLKGSAVEAVIARTIADHVCEIQLGEPT